MQFASAISRNENTALAARELSESVRRQLRGDIDLLVVFFSIDHREKAERLTKTLRRELAPNVLLGCTCGSVLGGEREIEGEPAISVLAATLPDVDITPFRVDMEEMEYLLDDTEEGELAERLEVDEPGEICHGTRAYIVFADPYTTPIVDWLAATDGLTPLAPTIGGMASGISGPGECVLALDGELYDQGLVGVRLGGDLEVETIVNHACRPIGETLLVTQADGNRLDTLGGIPALEVAQRLVGSLPEHEQELAQRGLYIGVVIDEYQPEFGRGDFVVRGVLSGDDETGALVIGDEVRIGQTVQFHVQDPEAAHHDFRCQLQKVACNETAPAGGLLITSSGRGIDLFDMPSHDVRCILEAVPETPLAGFFADGEFGQVGISSLMHCFTASMMLFRPMD